MGVQMEFDFEKKCHSTLSPNTVLSHPRSSNIEKRSTNRRLTGEDDLLRAKEGFTEISFRRYRSSSCKNVQSRTVGLDASTELKRGSLYQSSREASSMKKMGTKEGRRKIELCRASDTSRSFSIVDSLCSSDDENSDEMSPALFLSNTSKPIGDPRSSVEEFSKDHFIEIRPSLDERRKPSAAAAGGNLIQNHNFICEQVAGPLIDDNDLHERDTAPTFHKSFSVKVEVEMPQSPSPSVSPSMDRASSKSRFSPVRKIFDPFTKSKSLRSPLGYVAQNEDLKTTGMAKMRRNHTLQKPLLHEFSHAAQKADFDFRHVKKDPHHSAMACSPACLHGCLKLENKHGVPSFEFSLDCPKEAFVAKTWKLSNGDNWVYTFHSICGKKKTNAVGWGLTDGNNESVMVGQMQVSCYLCSEMKHGGVVDNSVLTEFVLYDIEHARQCVSAEVLPNVSKRPIDSHLVLSGRPGELNHGFDEMKLKHQLRQTLDPSNSYPCSSAVLHPHLEIAAIIIEFPFAKRESLKYKKGSSDNMHLNILSLSVAEQGKKEFGDSQISEKVKVVVPSGNHSLPSSETRGPSSLLDRWRSGGGCDCGGWDMTCPLTVFGNPNIQCTEGQPIMDNQRPLELFVQGKKEKLPAVSMTIIEEGQYAVDFHAQLTTLQAFSICVAMLHGMEVSNAFGEKKSKRLPQCNSLKALIEEEVKFLVESIAEEEKKKSLKTSDNIQQYYVMNPPFSPIARV